MDKYFQEEFLRRSFVEFLLGVSLLMKSIEKVLINSDKTFQKEIKEDFIVIFFPLPHSSFDVKRNL